MAMLNFKYGLYRNADGGINLPEAINNGTIYVTTDEKAMYVDLNDQRIRLSQIVTCTYEEWNNLQPPYSTEAFYYIIDKNALLKYNASSADAGYTAGWVQINSTKTLSDALDALTARVDAIEGKDYDGQLATVNETLQALSAKDQTLASNITDLGNDITAIESRIGGIDTVLNYLGIVTELPATGEANQICIYNNTIYIWAQNEDGSAGWAEYDDLVSQIEALKVKVDSMSSADTVEGLASRVSELETWKTEIDTVIAEKITMADVVALDYATKAEAQGYADAKDDAIAEAKAAGTKAQEDLAEYQAANDASVEAAQSRADAAYELAEGRVTSEQLAEAIKDFATTDDVATAKSEVLGSDSDAVGANTVAGANKAAAAAQEKANANEELINAIKDGETLDSFADVEAALSEINTTAESFATVEYVDNVANGLLGANAPAGATIAGAYAAAEAVEDDLAAYQTSNDAVINAIKDGEALDSFADVEAAIDDLETDILEKMQTADAMVFQGVVNSTDDLVTAQSDPALAKGWTYKAASQFELVEGKNIVIEWADADDTVVHIGDLLIADGEEDEDGILKSDIKWLQIPSGYVADYNPEMSIASGDNSAVIKLTSGAKKNDADETNDAAGDLGAITVAAEADSAVTVSAAGTQITIGMSWSTF